MHRTKSAGTRSVPSRWSDLYSLTLCVSLRITLTRRYYIHSEYSNGNKKKKKSFVDRIKVARALRRLIRGEFRRIIMHFFRVHRENCATKLSTIAVPACRPVEPRKRYIRIVA